MALTDEQMQDLQEIIKEKVAGNTNEVIEIVGKDKFYQMIHNLNDVTQVIAVVPVDNELGSNPNYQNTAIVVTYLKEPATIYT
ncbi:hypothetical protein [Streptococcus dentiloxodontae]